MATPSTARRRGKRVRDDVSDNDRIAVKSPRLSRSVARKKPAGTNNEAPTSANEATSAPPTVAVTDADDPDIADDICIVLSPSPEPEPAAATAPTTDGDTVINADSDAGDAPINSVGSASSAKVVSNVVGSSSTVVRPVVVRRRANGAAARISCPKCLEIHGVTVYVEKAHDALYHQNEISMEYNGATHIFTRRAPGEDYVCVCKNKFKYYAGVMRHVTSGKCPVIGMEKKTV
ncbi:hypothetical protein HK101_003710, partial [Irineochytrium annulatum]